MIVKKDHFGKRIIMAITGTLFAGESVGGLQKVNLGIDPFSSFVTAMANTFHSTYMICYILIIMFLLVAMLGINRKLLGVATVFNLLICGSVATAVKNILDKVMPMTPSMPVRIILLIVNLLIMCLGASLYFTANLGVSAYDAIALTLSEQYPRPAFRMWRISTDMICCIVGVICGVTIGIGTVITALCMGPAIQWFNEYVSNVILYGRKAKTITTYK